MAGTTTGSASAKKAGGKGSKKYGRTKRKNEGKTHPISLFVRNKISARSYFEMTGQSAKSGITAE